jgi:16S rRNA (cytidine1402-2'-O)-methyltransferase
MSKKPMLLLLPNLLGDFPHHEPFLPASVDKAVATIDGLIAESESAGRRFLSRFKLEKPVHLIPIALYNKNTSDEDLDFLLEPMMKGERWGLISDAGLPCIADPGSKLVLHARKKGIPVQAFVGPSSITLALMLSGLSGQRFMFLGYLDRDDKAKRKQIQDYERMSKNQKMTMIFMETPYRNKAMLDTLLETLQPETLLSVAWELTLPDQGVLTQTVTQWKKSPLPNIDKKNCLFLFSL